MKNLKKYWKIVKDNPKVTMGVIIFIAVITFAPVKLAIKITYKPIYKLLNLFF